MLPELLCLIWLQQRIIEVLEDELEDAELVIELLLK